MQDSAAVAEKLGCILRMQGMGLQQMEVMNRQLCAGQSWELDARTTRTPCAIMSDDESEGQNIEKLKGDDSYAILKEIFSVQKIVIKLDLQQRQDLGVWV